MFCEMITLYYINFPEFYINIPKDVTAMSTF